MSKKKIKVANSLKKLLVSRFRRESLPTNHNVADAPIEAVRKAVVGRLTQALYCKLAKLNNESKISQMMVKTASFTRKNKRLFFREPPAECVYYPRLAYLSISKSVTSIGMGLVVFGVSRSLEIIPDQKKNINMREAMLREMGGLESDMRSWIQRKDGEMDELRTCFEKLQKDKDIQVAEMKAKVKVLEDKVDQLSWLGWFSKLFTF